MISGLHQFSLHNSIGERVIGIADLTCHGVGKDVQAVPLKGLNQRFGNHRGRLGDSGESGSSTHVCGDRPVSWPGVTSLRATVRQDGRLLFTTDTVNPVLDGSEESVVVRLIPVPAARTSTPPRR